MQEDEKESRDTNFSFFLFPLLVFVLFFTPYFLFLVHCPPFDLPLFLFFYLFNQPTLSLPN